MTNTEAKCQHTQSYRYACIANGNERMFCTKCYQSHTKLCNSSRCGNLKKLNNTLYKNIQVIRFKGMLADMGIDEPTITQNSNFIEKGIQQFTLHIMKNMESEIPRMIYNKVNLMFQSVFSLYKLPQKFQNFIKSIPNIFEVQYQKDTQNYANSLGKMATILKEAYLQSHQKFGKPKSTITKTNLQNFKNIMKSLPNELEQSTTIRYHFYERLDIKLYQIIEKLSSQKLTAPTYHQIQRFVSTENQPQKSIRYGLNWNIHSLQKNPQALLTFSKHVLKQQVYKDFRKRKHFGFPFQQIYPFSTLSSPNEPLQMLLLRLQSKMADDINKRLNSTTGTSLYTLSHRFLILGPQLIDVQINSQRDRLHYQFNIKMYVDEGLVRKDRQSFVKQLLGIIGLTSQKSYKIPQNKKANSQIRFDSDIQRIYCFVRLAKSIIRGEGIESTLVKQNIAKYANEGKQFLKEQIIKIQKFSEVEF